MASDSEVKAPATVEPQAPNTGVAPGTAAKPAVANATEKPSESTSAVSKPETATDDNAVKDKVVQSSDAPKDADAKSRDTSSGQRNSGKPYQSNGKGFHRNPKKFKDNVKARYDHLPETDDPDEIRKQVEFYFSDSNLPMDNFLFGQVGGSENKPVAIKVVHSFKRMRRFQPFSAVVAALKDSEILEVTENEEIRRKVPLSTNASEVSRDLIKTFDDKSAPRSVYAKGFGEETEKTQLEIERFFEPYGPVRSVRLRRTYPTRQFKGSVFVEFNNEETQKAFLALDPKPKWNDTDLLIMGKKEYTDMKAADIKSGKIKPSYRPHGKNQSRKGDDRDWKSRRNDFQKNGMRDGARGEKRKRDGDEDEERKEKKPALESNGSGAAASEPSGETTEKANASSQPAAKDE
ncbi:hypothetical protein P152DRAFT_459334 [Eremomyces bilateralis CBS 781.70]|uniref:RNA-binding La domain-containing protein n=1 Tax=Eremomyces bilateralis CBS 781.70 TaxID=1392243 RepID=A0A6G1G168_9PEZI|nr:uncharacterized protein P152DRAFT_459334 [Eremomyces bilateralis CBS 781.70]KAF1811857.1 hypothetical protein P152DRAFT_459334 [Eremomyces bilateralis CBS 781.70]